MNQSEKVIIYNCWVFHIKNECNFPFLNLCFIQRYFWRCLKLVYCQLFLGWWKWFSMFSASHTTCLFNQLKKYPLLAPLNCMIRRPFHFHSIIVMIIGYQYHPHTEYLVMCISINFIISSLVKDSLSPL